MEHGLCYSQPVGAGCFADLLFCAASASEPAEQSILVPACFGYRNNRYRFSRDMRGQCLSLPAVMAGFSFEPSLLFGVYTPEFSVPPVYSCTG